jgi:hypothetical protein
MKTGLSALLAGLIFGLGLLLSGMCDPSKVLGFLDLAGNWDPSLAFVMGGAIAVAAPAFAWAKRHQRSLLDARIVIPAGTRIDGRLLLGSAAFGIGWGLAGFCPGPALVSAAGGYGNALIFAAAMAAGMLLYSLTQRRQKRV